MSSQFTHDKESLEQHSLTVLRLLITPQLPIELKSSRVDDIARASPATEYHSYLTSTVAAAGCSELLPQFPQMITMILISVVAKRSLKSTRGIPTPRQISLARQIHRQTHHTHLVNWCTHSPFTYITTIPSLIIWLFARNCIEFSFTIP